ncbi:glycoside hydrolase family 15 protein [Croceicoccus sp. F390]|uniref:Glycoside hydrolase family 15 protein n=1 Tax=Croceicoccus esteveae TaxID=3075597 RepID=A0ABU2ZJB3_9SPHN|nr:glycoside hydrolase family 15 protein [Croceicoccus sp. F390]MDT0576684.1 glycoside hydrolase family 15 protein [Croceicoccus sp. F390]
MSPPRKVQDYAIIGDGETAALVHRDGAMEWLCLPRFDSEACFAAILGDAGNGCWQMQPDDAIVLQSRRYRDDTLILETEFTTALGQVAIIDFMPMRGEAPDVVRIVEGRSGEVAMTSRLALRFDYGRIHPLVRTGQSNGTTLAICGPDGVRLDFDADIAFEKRWFTSQFMVRAGERRSFVLTWFASHDAVPDPVDPELALQETCSYWESWIKKARAGEHHPAQVRRSLLTMKALIHRPTGGIVAAPTSSLPETPGGTRNWDYRYCWLRDATFSLLALLQAGFDAEAREWLAWLRRAVAGEPIDLRPFYQVDGGQRILEWEADWLAGFNGTKPVRFGNAAVDQLQLDIYGEVIDTLHTAAQHGIEPDADTDMLMKLVADQLACTWQQPDAGIWEARGAPTHYVYSKVMCWVGFDRAADWFRHSDAERSHRYASLAALVRDDVMAHGLADDQTRFGVAYDNGALDASLLRLPMVGFIDANDPIMQATTRAIEDRLMRGHLVWRNDTEKIDDGVGGLDNAFLPCSFWMADVWRMQGRRDEAVALFAQLCERANDVGLLSEEANEHDLLGNFPQALTHLALVVTAINLGRDNAPCDRRAATSQRDRSEAGLEIS